MPEDAARLRKAYEDRVRALEASVRQRERELAILAAGGGARPRRGRARRRSSTSRSRRSSASSDLHAAWIFMGDDRGTEAAPGRLARRVRSATSRKSAREGLGECLCPEVFWSGHRMQARNTHALPAHAGHRRGPRGARGPRLHPAQVRGTGPRACSTWPRAPGEQFSEDELRFLETLGHQIGLAVERARHRRRGAARNQEARAMAAVSKADGRRRWTPAAVLQGGGRAPRREVLGARPGA